MATYVKWHTQLGLWTLAWTVRRHRPKLGRGRQAGAQKDLSGRADRFMRRCTSKVADTAVAPNAPPAVLFEAEVVHVFPSVADGPALSSPSAPKVLAEDALL